MELRNATQIVKPPPDSHFLLLSCGCGSDNVAYVETGDGLWTVRCFDCDKVLDHPEGKTKHGIQQVWNGGGRYGK